MWKMFKVKIKLDDITYGPKDESVDELTATTFAYELMKQGYRKTSNAYCMVSRIDRADWLEVMARARRCSVADFYNLDGSGVGDQHRDHYVRVFSKDNYTVHPEILRKMKAWR
jgi:hypothetical protein